MGCEKKRGIFLPVDGFFIFYVLFQDFGEAIERGGSGGGGSKPNNKKTA